MKHMALAIALVGYSQGGGVISGAAQLTKMPVWLPVMLEFDVSVAVRLCMPGAFKVALKVWVPASAAVNW